MSSRRGGVLVALVCTLAPLTAGCGADFTSGTRLIRPDAPDFQQGDIKIQNAVIVLGEDAQRGVLSVALINAGDQADTLDGVAVEGASEIQASTGRITVPPRGVVLVGGAEGPRVTVTRGGDKPALGDFAELRLSFARAGEARLEVPVLAPTGAYTSLTPAPEPTGSPSGTGTPTGGPGAPTGTLAPGAGGEQSPATGVEEGEGSTGGSPTPTPTP